MSYLGDLINSIIKTPVVQPQTVPDLTKPETWPAWLTKAVNDTNNASTTQRNQVLSLIAGAGGDAKADAKDIYDQTAANNAQDLINRGLNNSTIASTMNAGAQRALAREYQRADESAAQQAAGVLERQSMNGPDIGQFASLFRDASNKPGDGSGVAGKNGAGVGGGVGGFGSAFGPGFGNGGLSGLYGGNSQYVTPAIPGVDPRLASITHNAGSMTAISDGPVTVRQTEGLYSPGFFQGMFNYRQLPKPTGTGVNRIFARE
jgi:hypothetical protein